MGKSFGKGEILNWLAGLKTNKQTNTTLPFAASPTKALEKQL